MIKKKNDFDEMQKQKRDRIGSRMFGILSWVVILVAIIPMRLEEQDFAPIQWLLESGHNMGLTIAVIVVLSWLIYAIWLTKAGALVPFREKPKSFWVSTAVSLAIFVFFPTPVAVVIIVVIFAFPLIDKMKTKEERDKEKLDKINAEKGQNEEAQNEEAQ